MHVFPTLLIANCISALDFPPPQSKPPPLRKRRKRLISPSSSSLLPHLRHRYSKERERWTVCFTTVRGSGKYVRIDYPGREREKSPFITTKLGLCPKDFSMFHYRRLPKYPAPTSPIGEEEEEEERRLLFWLIPRNYSSSSSFFHSIHHTGDCPAAPPATQAPTYYGGSITTYGYRGERWLSGGMGAGITKLPDLTIVLKRSNKAIISKSYRKPFRIFSEKFFWLKVSCYLFPTSSER